MPAQVQIGKWYWWYGGKLYAFKVLNIVNGGAGKTATCWVHSVEREWLAYEARFYLGSLDGSRLIPYKELSTLPFVPIGDLLAAVPADTTR